MNFTAESGRQPKPERSQFSRSFELEGDRLVVTSTEEPQAQGHTRWVWQRFPTVENLSPAYREVAGFWRNVGERQVVQATGAIERESQRGPASSSTRPPASSACTSRRVGASRSPAKLRPRRKRKRRMRGYIGYFGGLGVYPGEVSHNILSGVPNMGGAILRRYAEITGDELIVRLQGTVRTSNDPRGSPPSRAQTPQRRRRHAAAVTRNNVRFAVQLARPPDLPPALEGRYELIAARLAELDVALPTRRSRSCRASCSRATSCCVFCALAGALVERLGDEGRSTRGR